MLAKFPRAETQAASPVQRERFAGSKIPASGKVPGENNPIELRPDGSGRFERPVDAAAQKRPQRKDG